MATRIIKCCANCGGQNVMLDAWASWSVDRQEWELAQTFDDAFCEDCEGETTVEDREQAETHDDARRRLRFELGLANLAKVKAEAALAALDAAPVEG